MSLLDNTLMNSATKNASSLATARSQGYIDGYDAGFAAGNKNGIATALQWLGAAGVAAIGIWLVVS